mgnify:CR=1 FL=1
MSAPTDKPNRRRSAVAAAQAEGHALKAVSLDWLLEDGILAQGSTVAIVTAAPIYHGVLVSVTATHYVLDDAAWVVETGRLHEFISDPTKAQEAEYVGRVLVPVGSVIAIYETAPGKVTTR